MDALHEFFTLNRPLVLFVYGQTFFVMGLAIFLQSRRYSRLRLAHDLRWLAAFGVLHGLYEWGDVFIPIQATYLPEPYIDLLLTLHILLLATSFTCLFIFGVVTLSTRWHWGWQFVMAAVFFWGAGFWISLYSSVTLDQWHQSSAIWARYLLGIPGSLLAAYGLRYQTQTQVVPLGVGNIYRMLQITGLALVAYAFFGGAVVTPGNFFPANFLNRVNLEVWLGFPVEVFRSAIGLVLALSVIRALEVFEIELDRIIEEMEVERIQDAERDRIGQEIHDGAVQAVYSASLILESMQQHVGEDTEAAVRLDRAKRVLSGAISDLRRYMSSLRSDIPHESLADSLRQLVHDPRFSSLLQIQVKFEVEPDLKPTQVGHIVAIVQESLSNTLRHGKGRRVTLGLCREASGLMLKIQDDGQGFDERTITPGYGLRAMRDRARLLSGTLDIQSLHGKGTTITLQIPEENGL